MTAPASAARVQEATRVFLRLIRPRPLADPYPDYRLLRESAPVHSVRLPGVGEAWVSASHAEVSLLLRDRRFGPLSPDHLDVLSPGWRCRPFTACMYRAMAFRHGGEHRAGRSLVAGDFTARAALSHRATVVRLAEELLDGLAEGDEETDLVESLALPFGALTIGRALGVPDEPALELARLFRTAGVVFEPMATAGQRAAQHLAGERMLDLIRALLADRRDAPRDDLLTRLAHHPFPAENPDLPDEGALSAVTMLIGAGSDSPVSMAGLGARLLMEHPAQAALLRADPSLARPAAEEILRHEPPVQLVVRSAYTDAVLDGVPIPRGGVVFGLLASANRDPSAIADPDRFDLTRAPGPTLAFGAGAHYCLGAALARLQAEVLFPRLLGRFPALRPAGAPRYRTPGTMLRGLDHLPVTLR